MQPGQRRAAIVATATPLVERFGADVTTRQIAEAAGIAEGTIFRVFPDKNAVIGAVVEATLNPGNEVIAFADIPDHLTLRERVEYMATAISGRLQQAWRVMGALRFFAEPNAEEAQRFMTRVTERNERLTAAIASALEPFAPELRYSPAETARILRMAVLAFTHPRITDENPLPIKQITAILLDGMQQAPPHEEHPPPGASRSSTETTAPPH